MVEVTLENSNESASVFLKGPTEKFLGRFYVNEGTERIEASSKNAYQYTLVGTPTNIVTRLAPQEKLVWKVKIEDIWDDEGNSVFGEKLGNSLLSARLELTLSTDSRKGFKRVMLTTSPQSIPHQSRTK